MMNKLSYTCALLSDDGLIITLITAGSNVLLLINVFRADRSSSGVVTVAHLLFYCIELNGIKL